ncbi:uncharacterized protein LOC127854151 isoform X2 [Dreissena polymorpha]|uniref:uncharacterized protein LOC127854151 isoform X2 n=1 Tax=Dreissena polymorpha TaxID=45954 RepID=UPI0022646E0B|nr:uncharacterized protein LOC127854151 isoform X2 [Dreissena polymorpha]
METPLGFTHSVCVCLYCPYTHILHSSLYKSILLTFSAPTAIRCGTTWCENVGYESCIRPPEIRSEQDSDCYSCDKLALVGDPCDPVNSRLGCVLYCIDKAKENENQIWNQSQEAMNLTWQNLVKEKDNNITLFYNSAVDYARRVKDANRKMQLYFVLFVTTLVALCLIVPVVVMWVRWKYRRQVGTINEEDPGEHSTTSGPYSETQSELAQSVDESIVRPIESVIEVTDVVSRETTEDGEKDSQNDPTIQSDVEDFRDGRLNNISPQQNDMPSLYTGSRTPFTVNSEII